jgi:hypothetical protein
MKEDTLIAEKAAELRRPYGWKLPDAFQAAILEKSNLLKSPILSPTQSIDDTEDKEEMDHFSNNDENLSGLHFPPPFWQLQRSERFKPFQRLGIAQSCQR